LNKRKKIISIVIKLLVGVACFALVYFRLKSDFNLNDLHLLRESVFSGPGLIYLLVCMALIPVNWGIESYKWKIITWPVENISFITAQKSVYSGVCLGNLAPGRATEFLAKIIFFEPGNRPKITVLHFVNGMFQLSVTYLAGFIALAYKIKSFGPEYIWIAYLTGSIAGLIILVFIISLFKIDKVLHFVSKKISKQQKINNFKYEFTRLRLTQLFGFSFVRFAVFTFQMVLLIGLFFNGPITLSIILSIALYFLITTTIPMISVLEPAIRAAIALVVFKDTGISNTAMALASVSIWIINIIIPSIIGYVFLLRQNFDFNFRKKTA
jgi:hypothetical protein